MADFIDAFDHEHSSPRVVLFRRETRRHRSRGAQYSVWHSATGGQRTNRETGRVTWHQAVSAAAIRALARGRGAFRVHQTVLR